MFIRYCSNPPPAFKGKECDKTKPGEKGRKLEWLSHESAQLDITDCITEMNKGDYPDVKPEDITKWCPEHCIMTEWNSWSRCSQTCMKVLSIAFNLKQGQNDQ